MFSYVSPEDRVPADHPLRPIRLMTDMALKALSSDNVVLNALGIDDRWTHSDDIREYQRWVDAARSHAGPLSIAEWECGAWLKGRPD
jgi:hypothetical protein